VTGLADGAFQAVLAATIGPVPTTVLLGVGAAAAVWGLRFLIRKRRERAAGSSRGGARGLRSNGRGIKADAGSGTAVVQQTGSAAPDVAVRIPVPIGDRQPIAVRHAELYAVELGLVGGGMLAWLASLAVVDPLVGALFGAVMGAVSFWRVRTMAATTVTRATGPWLAATILGAAVGVVLFF
jgi:hypothetical protein